MSRLPMSFFHPDTSTLAKFLKREIVSDTHKLSDVLNALARSRGFRNHAAHKAAVGSRADDRLVAVEYNDNSFREIFIRDAQGQTIDRRHVETVSHLAFTANFDINLGALRWELMVIAKGYDRGWEFDRDYQGSVAGGGEM